jgi:hypothetical protein
MRHLLFVLSLTVAGSICAAPRDAVADPPDRSTCARSYEQAQRRRQSHELRAAREDLLVCSKKECPAWMRRDCVPWLADVEAAIPSIVVEANRSDARATLDGVPVGSEAVRVDPGDHVIVVDAPGAARVEERVRVGEGDGTRRIAITLADAPLAPPPKPPPPSTPAHERPVPTLVWILGGAGLAAGGVGAVFQIAGMNERSDLSTCAPACAHDDVSAAKTSLWTGNVLLGVSVVALAGALVLYVTRPESEQ